MNRLLILCALLLSTSIVACDDDASDAAAPDAFSGDNDTPDVSADDANTGDTNTGDASADDASTADGAVDDAGDDAGGGPECVTDADCMLVNDCCTCAAAPLGEDSPACAADCIQPRCDAAGIEEFTCKAGVCALSNVDCDIGPVTCEVAPPVCEAGTTAHVGGDCYTGLCVPVEACRSVSSCDECTADQTCVTFETMLGPQYNCAPTPDACGATPDCACLGDEICEDPFICSPGDTLMCVCPVC